MQNVLSGSSDSDSSDSGGSGCAKGAEEYPYEIFRHLEDDMVKMDSNGDFHTLYRISSAFTEAFIHLLKKRMCSHIWKFFYSRDEYAQNLRTVVSAHLDENAHPLIRLASLKRMTSSSNNNNLLEFMSGGEYD